MHRGSDNTTTRRTGWAAIMAVCLLGVLLLASCGGDDGGGTGPPIPDNPDTAAEYTDRGWERFEAANYSDALADFNSAIDLDASYGAAYTGQGWTRLAQATSSTSMETAVGSFGNAISNGASGAEVLAGRAAANLGAGGSSLDAAVADAAAALAADADFVFSHRTSISAADLHLISAFAKAAKGDFPGALTAADLVLDSSIQEGSSGSWVVDGTHYSSFVGAVMAHLNKVSGQYSG